MTLGDDGEVQRAAEAELADRERAAAVRHPLTELLGFDEHPLHFGNPVCGVVHIAVCARERLISLPAQTGRDQRRRRNNGVFLAFEKIEIFLP